MLYNLYKEYNISNIIEKGENMSKNFMIPQQENYQNIYGGLQTKMFAGANCPSQCTGCVCSCKCACSVIMTDTFNWE